MPIFNQHIILMGFPQCGKSTIGKALSTQLNLKLTDLDHVIESLYQKRLSFPLNCREIYQQCGETYFRELETEALTTTLHQKPHIIALGGGAVLRFQNQLLLMPHHLIYIDTPFSILIQRLSENTPAFLKNTDSFQQQLSALQENRSHIYENMASQQIINNDTVENALKKITASLKNDVAGLTRNDEMRGKVERATGVYLSVNEDCELNFNKADRVSRKSIGIGKDAILLLHGPNLNQLGKRDTQHYGKLTLAELEHHTRNIAAESGFLCRAFQSNHEGELIDWLQALSPFHQGILINPGAFGAYSYALHDAILDTQLPCVEVHLSNIHQRESWRSHSVIQPACIAQFYGKKTDSYREAMQHLIAHIKQNVYAENN